MIRFIFITRILPLLSAVLAGVLAGSLWVGLLVALGLLVLTRGYYERNVLKRAHHIAVEILMGMAMIGAAGWLGSYAGRWLWTVIWLLAAMPSYVAGATLYGKASAMMGALALLASGVCLVLAVLSPYLSEGRWMSGTFYVWSLVWVLGIFGFVLMAGARLKGMRAWSTKAIALGLLLAIAGLVGAAAGRVDVGAATLGGMLLLYSDIRRIVEAAIPKYTRYLVMLYSGMVLIILATWLDALRSGWMWAPVWIVTAIPFLVLGAWMFQADETENQTGGRWGMASGLALVTGLLCLLFALVGPSLLRTLPPPRAVYTGILVASGYLLVFVGWSESAGYWGKHLVLSLLGLPLLTWAWMLSAFVGPWIWVVLWIGAGALIAFGAKQAPNWAARTVGLLLALLCAGAAAAGPRTAAYLGSVLPDEAGIGTWDDVTDALGIGPFVALGIAVLAYTIIMVSRSSRGAQDESPTGSVEPLIREDLSEMIADIVSKDEENTDGRAR